MGYKPKAAGISMPDLRALKSGMTYSSFEFGGGTLVTISTNTIYTVNHMNALLHLEEDPKMWY